MKVAEATYSHDYIISIQFSNGENRSANLRNFIFSAKNPMTAQFRDKNKFKKFAVRNGYLTWSDAMDLPADYLYQISKLEMQER